MIGGDLLKPYNSGGHAAYHECVLTQLRKYYPDAATSLSSSTWDIMKKFWNLDLFEVDIIMQDRYSNFGPPPRLPSDMLRSILLSVEVKITSYTKWANNLKENQLHAILSGFTVGDTPSIGIFMIFSPACDFLTNIICPLPYAPKGKTSKAKEGWREKTIRGLSMIHRAVVKNGSWSLTQELLRNAVINVRK